MRGPAGRPEKILRPWRPAPPHPGPLPRGERGSPLDIGASISSPPVDARDSPVRRSPRCYGRWSDEAMKAVEASDFVLGVVGSKTVTWWPARQSCCAAARPAGPEPTTATVLPVRTTGRTGTTHHSAKARSMMETSIDASGQAGTRRRACRRPAASPARNIRPGATCTASVPPLPATQL